MLVEPCVFRRDDRVPQRRRDVVVADDDAALGGELADRLAVAREEPRDGVGAIVVKRADCGDVPGKREEHAAQGAKERGDDEQNDEACLLGHTNNHAASGARLLVVVHHQIQYSGAN